jgi:hypothetical protein
MTPSSAPRGEPVPSGQSHTPPSVPAEVEAVAAQRQLGELWDARIVANPRSIAKVALIGVPFMAVAAIGLPSENTVLGILGLLAAFGVLIALVVLAYAVKTALAGADDWYLYTNGFVDGRRRQVRAVTWAEVSTITRARMGHRTSKYGTLITKDTLRGYEVSVKDGTGHFLTAVDAFDEGRRLCAQLERLAAQAGVPLSG